MEGAGTMSCIPIVVNAMRADVTLPGLGASCGFSHLVGGLDALLVLFALIEADDLPEH